MKAAGFDSIQAELSALRMELKVRRKLDKISLCFARYVVYQTQRGEFRSSLMLRKAERLINMLTSMNPDA